MSHPNSWALGSPGARQQHVPLTAVQDGVGQEPLLPVPCKGPRHCCSAERPTPQDLRGAAGLGLWVFKSRASGVPPAHRRCHWHLEDSTFIREVQSFSSSGEFLSSHPKGLGKTPTPVYHSSNSAPDSINSLCFSPHKYQRTHSHILNFGLLRRGALSTHG